MPDTVTITVEEIAGALGLEVLESGEGAIRFTSGEIGRPGLQFTGFYDHFASRRVQLIGNAEMYYLYSLDYEGVRERMERFMSHRIPCIVCTRGNRPPEALLDVARAHAVPVFLSEGTTDPVGHRITEYVGRRLAPRALLHGVLLDVFGAGVYLKGMSGLGKSETALEMIRSGHRLVADDVVEVTRVSQTKLVGRAPEAIRHLIEVRGIGVVDVRYLFGVGAVVDEKQIDYIIELRPWDSSVEYERLGGKESVTRLLDVEVPTAVIPVSPGRNLSVVVEVAARNFLLKRMGYDTSGEFIASALTAFERRDEK